MGFYMSGSCLAVSVMSRGVARAVHKAQSQAELCFLTCPPPHKRATLQVLHSNTVLLEVGTQVVDGADEVVR